VHRPYSGALAALLLFVQPGAHGADMTRHARGSFEVKIAPEGQPDTGDGSVLGRMSLDKTFHGDLTGHSSGTMLTAGSSAVKGSAAYVAVERFTGALGGRKGSFALVHRGTMSAAGQDLDITVVPDSGSGELTGISGKLGIVIDASGGHAYDLEYSLP
jgi:hypothetical protein